jgi:DNA-binding SARP family transcriptional activator
MPVRLVEINVLGPVEVAGTACPFRRAAALDLVVYLAFHREGVRHDQWAIALWPDQAVALATVHSTASDARRALGRAADGAPLVSSGACIRLHEAVVSDVDRFDALAHSGHPDRLLEAVELLRGRPFSGMRRADWAVLDGTQAQVEGMVVRAVLQGADDLLRHGRPAESEWMVRRGLVVSPYDERLYRALLRALAAQGNRVRLRGAMAELLTVAADAPFAAPLGRRSGAEMSMLHPETTSLYQDLLCGWPATGGAPARL